MCCLAGGDGLRSTGDGRLQCSARHSARFDVVGLEFDACAGQRLLVAGLHVVQVSLPARAVCALQTGVSALELLECRGCLWLANAQSRQARRKSSLSCAGVRVGGGGGDL